MLNNKIIIFDLDDTLYKEIDFLKSAYKEISQMISHKINLNQELIFSDMMKYYFNGLNAFEMIIDNYKIKDLNKKELIFIYRNHCPQISLELEVMNFLFKLKQEIFKIGLLTDGRGLQQRNKLLALGLTDYFDDIIISEEFGSEKPAARNYKYFMDKYGESHNYVYVGDNVKKDFITPNSLGWNTICILDNGTNIHKQDFNVKVHFLPDFYIKNLTKILKLKFNKKNRNTII